MFLTKQVLFKVSISQKSTPQSSTANTITRKDDKIGKPKV